MRELIVYNVKKFILKKWYKSKQNSSVYLIEKIKLYPKGSIFE
jgi:hypothetical protein